MKRRVFFLHGLSAVVLLFCLALVLFPNPAFAAPRPGETALEIPPMEMTLADAIAVALRSNRSVRSAYLQRVLDKFALEKALEKFDPTLDLNSTAGLDGSRTKTEGQSEDGSSSAWNLNNTLGGSKGIETGGNFTYSWARSDNLANSNTGPEDQTGNNTWKVGFSQPLLKGFGKELNTASIVQAELAEQSNLLGFRDSIIGTVDGTISAFRSYAQALRQVEISKASVERSQATLETNKLLISMGRMPANELIQTESDLANQELSNEGTLNSLDSARLDLIKILDLDQNTQINVIEEKDFSPQHPDFDTCLKIAFENRADYFNAQKAIKDANIELMRKEDEKKWQLDLGGNYTVNDNNNRHTANIDTNSWDVGLALGIPLYGTAKRDLDRNVVSAQIGLKRAKMNLLDVEQTITLGLKDAIRQVETSLKQVGMAVRARELSQKKLEVEREKLKVGRTTNFQLVSFQNELVTSQTSELDTKLAYLNALKDLDTFLATTLDTWKIDYNKENDQWPGK